MAEDLARRHIGATEIASAIARRLSPGSTIEVCPDRLRSYGHDAWPVSIKESQMGRQNYCPDVAVMVATREDVAAVLSWADAAGVPVTPWGLGSSVVGAPLAVNGGITLDMSRMNRILEIDEENLVVRVEAGVNGGALEAALNARSLTLNHSPQSLLRSTVGGWIASRATGQFSSRYGGIEDLCTALDVVLVDGTLVETPDLPRMAVGPDLKQLFVGSEGCLGVVTAASLRIFPLAQERMLETASFPTVVDGVRAMRAIMAAGLRPFLLRFYDLDEARHTLGDPGCPSPVMFFGCEGQRSVAKAELGACIEICRAHGGTLRGLGDASAWMDRRFDFSTIESVIGRPGGIAETIEVSHRWSGIVATYEAMRQRLKPHVGEAFAHFSHAYTNGVSLYFIVLGEAEDAAAAQKVLRRIWEIAMETAIETGAAISHHHGTGLARAGYVRRFLGTGAELLDRIKRSVDPRGTMNPGKLGLNGAQQDRARKDTVR